MNEPRKPRRSRRLLWIAAVGLFVVALGVSGWLFGSPPPRRIVLATGDPDGGFAALGRDYQARLQRMGLKVDLRGSSGSIANLRMLVDGSADVAFVQAGVAEAVDGADHLCALAAIGAHPFWVFSSLPEPTASVRDLKGRRVVVGPPASGTDVLGRLLLGEYGVTAENTTFLNRPIGQTPRCLTDGTADAAFLVCMADTPVIRELLTDPRVRRVGLGDHRAALARRFRYLRPVDVPRGGLDLARDVPPGDLHLLAPRTVLAAREDLHPRVVEQLLLAAQAIHAGGNRFDDPGRFPTLEGIDLPPHVAAERFLTAGESFLSRLLPYWAVRLVWQAQLFLLPALALSLPFWKTLPLLYTFRVNRILRRHYAALREIEGRLDRSADPVELRKLLEQLDGLRTDLETLSRKLPYHLQRDVYHWRLHVALVRTEARDRLRRLEEASGLD